MKIYVTALCLLVAAARGQYVGTPTVLPQPATTNDSIRVIVGTMTPNLGHKLQRWAGVTKTGVVTINICNYSGMFTAIDYYVDTFSVGKLPAGTWSLDINYVISGDPQNCDTSAQYHAAGEFTVQAVTALPVHPLQEAIVYPSPADHYLYVALPVHGNLVIYDQSGSPVYTSHANGTHERIDTRNFPDGIYVITVSGTMRRPQKVAIIHAD